MRSRSSTGLPRQKIPMGAMRSQTEHATTVLLLTTADCAERHRFMRPDQYQIDVTVSEQIRLQLHHRIGVFAKLKKRYRKRRKWAARSKRKTSFSSASLQLRNFNELPSQETRRTAHNLTPAFVSISITSRSDLADIKALHTALTFVQLR